MSDTQPFCYENFRLILSEAKQHGYTFCRFDEPVIDSLSKRCYLRHDVDISPACALRLGQIAAEMNVRSNIFFQLNAETYNIFSPATLSIITQLREAGHCVGLHVDENIVGSDEEKIRSTIQWFSECCVSVDNAVSFHRPSKAILGKDFDGFASGYGSQVWGEDRYLSDSRRSWDFRSRFSEWLKRGTHSHSIASTPRVVASA